MLTQLTLKNFKAFQELTLELRPLTLLTGANCSGKSTVLQALLLLQQSELAGELEHKRLLLNGGLIQLGRVIDVLPESANDELALSLCWREGSKTTEAASSWSEVEAVTLKANCPDLQQRSLTLDITAEQLKSVRELIQSRHMRYVSAGRLGPRPFEALADQDVVRQRVFDPTGETALHFLSHNRKAPVERALCLPRVSQSVAAADSSDDAVRSDLEPYLFVQCERWLSLIVPGLRLNLEEVANLDLMRVGFEFSGKLGWSRGHRPTNVGFGLTYVLPVILGILAAKPGELVLLENPEAHLHPGAQYALGALLARAATAGIQVMVETHSDHILNAIRVEVRKSKLSPEHVRFHFFFRDPQDFHLFRVESPQLKSNGKLSDWPPGFFDQWDIALQELLQPMPKRNP